MDANLLQVGLSVQVTDVDDNVLGPELIIESWNGNDEVVCIWFGEDDSLHRATFKRQLLTTTYQ